MGAERHINEDLLNNILPQHEQARIKGQAMGKHIGDSLIEALGGEESIRSSASLEAWDTAHQHFQGEDIRSDSDDRPYMHVPMGDKAHGRYFMQGPYMDVYRNDESSPFEVMHIDKEDRKNPEALRRRASSWLDEARADYDI